MPSLRYDQLMKIPIILFTLALAGREAYFLREYLMHIPVTWDLAHLSGLAARITLILFLLVLVALHAVRIPPVNKAPGLQPRISAIMGLTVSLLILFLERAPAAGWIDSLSAMLLLLGNYLCIVTVMHLGRSISIMAEARRLVTSGPYRMIRHPLYFCEEIGYIGLFLQFRSWEAAAILIVHFAFQVQRMRNEERVLLATFPEYGDYMQRTYRMIPGIW